MKDSKEFELLIDIARLLKKYGSQTFEDLAKIVSSPEFSEQFSAILTSTATSYRASKPTKKGKRTPTDFRSKLSKVAESEPEKSQLLLKLYDGLAGKVFLPTLKDIQAFVSDAGLAPLRATAREKAVGELINTLLLFPLDEIKAKVSAIRPITTQYDRSLEGWSNIILDKRRRTTQSGE